MADRVRQYWGYLSYLLVPGTRGSFLSHRILARGEFLVPYWDHGNSLFLDSVEAESIHRERARGQRKQQPYRRRQWESERKRKCY